MESSPRQQDHGDSSEESAQIKQSPQISPMTRSSADDSSKMAHDSMVTVRLSEPPSLTIDTTFTSADPSAPGRPNTVRLDKTPISEVAGEGIGLGLGLGLGIRQDTEEDKHITSNPSTPRTTLHGARNMQDELRDSEEQEEEEPPQEHQEPQEKTQSRRSSMSDEVDWEQLQKSEAEEPKDEDTDRVRQNLCSWGDPPHAPLPIFYADWSGSIL